MKILISYSLVESHLHFYLNSVYGENNIQITREPQGDGVSYYLHLADTLTAQQIYDIGRVVGKLDTINEIRDDLAQKRSLF